jgi:signal transduction histidine kinase
MKLLIIDDERPILEMLELSLSEEGYDVLTAENGEKGIEIFQEQSPKLVLTDVKMPGIDGIEVLRRIKSINDEAEVIVITGHGDMETAIAALQNQASDFVTKPIQDEVLMLSLDRAKRRLAMTEQIKTYTDSLEHQIESCRLELLQAQEEVIKTERRASIGETVAALAHCMKNVLTGLGGGMYMAQVGMAQEKSDMLEEGWAMFQRNMERVSDLILDLLRYSTERTPDREICSPNQIVSEAVERLRKKAEKNDVKLKTTLDKSLKEAYFDRDSILKVLSNVISNAIEACVYDTATSKAWEVTVSTKKEIDAESSDMVIFEVADNGCGMTDEVKAQLFHRFFTTKPGLGVGFDLLVTQKIIHEHGGEISLDSKPGEGTTFSVRLNCQMPAEYDRFFHC